jgi:squalene-hopene/tetraprenyl-beta-curcumene cyclase
MTDASLSGHQIDMLRIGIPITPGRVDACIAAASDWLLARQEPAGFWCGELEGDTTLESYMILLEAFFGRRDSAKVKDLARVIRDEMLPAGGWSQYAGGPADLSVSCLSYFALKVAGEAGDDPAMRRSRDAILALGGVEGANTYTRYHFALFGQLPWTDVPAIPPEMLFLPAISPFTIYDMSSWSRTIFIPLAILWARKPTVPLPAACGAPELFRTAAGMGAPPGSSPDAPGGWKKLFLRVDRFLKQWERMPGAGALRARAVKRAEAWILERLQDSDGLSAILPAMANSVLALRTLGHADDDPVLVQNLAHLDDLTIRDESGALRVQPCLSPVWDTVLASSALLQAGIAPDSPALARAADWLLGKQTKRKGDWAARNPAPPGGWYFEHRNEFYPDVDDTCMALIVLSYGAGTVGDVARADAVRRGMAWMMGMQNSDGGWGSFDRDNDKQWLTEIPFADHNAMIDPSTADITGRVLECLARFPGYSPAHPAVSRALEFLRRDQTTEGCWYGRWGVNYIYGTWQVLRGLGCIGEDMRAPYVRRAASWLRERQNSDGGWGESIASYDHPGEKGVGVSTPSQTAWAVMGLVAAGEADSSAVRRGVSHLIERQHGGTWEQTPWTGTGFPRVFYLNYQYYRHYFPLMALAQYRAALARADVHDGPERVTHSKMMPSLW